LELVAKLNPCSCSEPPWQEQCTLTVTSISLVLSECHPLHHLALTTRMVDDPLSAVDANVGRHIFDECIRGALRGKTIVIVTHQLQVGLRHGFRWIPRDIKIFLSNRDVCSTCRNATALCTWTEGALPRWARMTSSSSSTKVRSLLMTSKACLPQEHAMLTALLLPRVCCPRPCSRCC